MKVAAGASDVVLSLLPMPPLPPPPPPPPSSSSSSSSSSSLASASAAAAAAYEARRKRTEWPESVRADDEVKALDERNGEWILCRTCADHYDKTGRGRKPNDPDGFKVKMNGRFHEAAWIVHKNRVVAHKAGGALGAGGAAAAHDATDSGGSQAGGSPRARDPFLRDHHDAMGIPDAAASSGASDDAGGSHHDLHPAKRHKPAGGSDVESDDAHHVPGLDLVVSEASGPFFMEEMKFDDGDAQPHGHAHSQPQQPLHASSGGGGTGARTGGSVQLPRTGWRCPGVVPDFFYQAHAELVHAFAKYYVGSYRVNVVRDLRSDKVMLYSHDCENRIVHRERPNQPISCDKCYAIWLHNKSFKRILKKMDRYNLVEDILRKSWSITEEDLSVLSKFKHSSGANLNIEGRKLKQAAITVLKRFNARKSPPEPPAAARLQLPQQTLAALGLPSLEAALPDSEHSGGSGAGLHPADSDAGVGATPQQAQVPENAEV
ncbi:hypothetical protein PybrP1_006834 [[Pythium] brassicae (nom. inval.)]|nr:hypothetical protein PybrP1_006834 [[Pythium] brassicae (nom. inval.)]